MAAYFLDSSAIAKLSHEEVGSSAVEKLVRGAASTLLISRLSVVEVQSAFAGKVRSGVISAGDATSLRRRFLEHIANGVFKVVALTGEHWDQAGGLIERHGASRGLRTLDSLQLAIAMSLRSGDATDALVSSDRILCRVAGAEGIPFIDPESVAP